MSYNQTVPGWMWWSAIALCVVNAAALAFLWWTPMPDLSVFTGHTPKHDLKPVQPTR